MNSLKSLRLHRSSSQKIYWLRDSILPFQTTVQNQICFWRYNNRIRAKISKIEFFEFGKIKGNFLMDIRTQTI